MKNQKDNKEQITSWQRQKNKVRKYKMIAAVTGGVAVVAGVTTGIVLGTQRKSKEITDTKVIYTDNADEQIKQFETKVDEADLHVKIKAKLKDAMRESVKKARTDEHLKELKKSEDARIAAARRFYAAKIIAEKEEFRTPIDPASLPTGIAKPGPYPIFDLDTTSIFSDLAKIVEATDELERWIKDAHAYNSAVLEANNNVKQVMTSASRRKQEAFEKVSMAKDYIYRVMATIGRTTGISTFNDPSDLRGKTIDQIAIADRILEIPATEIQESQWNDLNEALSSILTNLEALKADVAKEVVDKLMTVEGEEIPAEFFKNLDLSKLESGELIIPEKFRFIGENAFQGAKLPRRFVLPNNLLLIGTGAFRSADFSATSEWSWHVAPGLVPSIRSYSFTNTKLPLGFYIPEGVRELEERVFENAVLPESFTIPRTITSIGSFTFENADLSMATNFKWLKSIDGGVKPFAFKKAKMPTNFQIDEGVIMIDPYSLSEARFEDGFVLPSTIRTLEQGAFKRAVIKKGFFIPVGVEMVMEGVFEEAEMFDAVNFGWPEHLPTIPPKTFRGAMLPTHFYIEGAVTEIGANAFERALLSPEFELPEGLTIIRRMAFDNTTLYANFKLPLSLIDVEEGAFRNANLEFAEKLIWPNNLPRMKPSMFEGSKMHRNFRIEQGVETISESAFYGTKFGGRFQVPTTVVNFGKFVHDGEASPDTGVFAYADLSKGFDWKPSAVSNIDWRYMFYAAVLPQGFEIPEIVNTLAESMFENAILPIGFEIPRRIFPVVNGALEAANLPAGCKWVDSVTGEAIAENWQINPRISGIRVDYPIVK